jgi:hypothetical protein
VGKSSSLWTGFPVNFRAQDKINGNSNPTRYESKLMRIDIVNGNHVEIDVSKRWPNKGESYLKDRWLDCRSVIGHKGERNNIIGSEIDCGIKRENDRV